LETARKGDCCVRDIYRFIGITMSLQEVKEPSVPECFAGMQLDNKYKQGTYTL